MTIHMQTTGTGKLRAWLQLIRLPNLLTAPGDPLAGYLLAGGAWDAARITAACGVSLLLYIAGLIDNDLVDMDEDRRDRPNRPLPRRAVSPGWAGTFMTACLIGAMYLASTVNGTTLLTASALCIAIAVYNHLLKSNRLLGALGMGGCRALSLLVGAAAAGPLFPVPPAVSAAAGLLGLYIAALTWIAAKETEDPTGRRSRAVGVWIANLVLLQAAFCLAADPRRHWIPAVILILIRPIIGRWRKTYYMS